MVAVKPPSLSFFMRVLLLRLHAVEFADDRRRSARRSAASCGRPETSRCHVV